MAVNLSPLGGVAAQFFNNDGVPLSGGLIYTYTAGSTTPATTYTTGAGNIPHSNPIVLDSAGRVPTGEIWLTDNLAYKFVIKDAQNNLIGTYDNLVGINSNFVNYTASQEIQTATAGQTVFTLTTMVYQPGTNSLTVFVDGVNQYGPGAQYAFVETSSTSVTFASGLHVGASVKFTTAVINNIGGINASQVTYDPPFLGSESTNVAAKLAETPSVGDFGAAGGADNTTQIQYGLDTQSATFQAIDYEINAPLKVPSLSKFVGQHAGIGFTGTTATVKSAIKKTTNTTAAITNFQTHVTSNIDCLMYIDPDWIDAGAAYPQKADIESISFDGAASSPNDIGIYIEQGGGYTFRNLDFANINHAIWAKEAWLTVVERVHAQSKFVWLGGTSVTFTDCWTGSGTGSTGGYSFASLIYSTMNSCASDTATNTAYRFVNSKLTLNSCGCENASTLTANSGTAIAFDGGNEVVLNNFNVVPQANQTIALFSVNSDETITFNQGTADFNVTGVNCPDFYIWGNNSIVTLNDYVSWNGTKDTPVIQFGVGVSTSKVVVNYTTPSGTNTKIYYSDGLGNTLSEVFFDAGTFNPEVSFGGATTGVTYTSRSGWWQKCGSVITVGGRVTLSNKGSATGVAALSGWPLFDPKGDASMQLPYIVNITGGPLFGVVDIAGAGAKGVFTTQTATGTVNATDTNFANNTTFWFTFTYQTNSVFI